MWLWAYHFSSRCAVFVPACYMPRLCPHRVPQFCRVSSQGRENDQLPLRHPQQAQPATFPATMKAKSTREQWVPKKLEPGNASEEGKSWKNMKYQYHVNMHIWWYNLSWEIIMFLSRDNRCSPLPILSMIHLPKNINENLKKDTNLSKSNGDFVWKEHFFSDSLWRIFEPPGLNIITLLYSHSTYTQTAHSDSR